jgi:hypothetical protein
MTKVAFNWIQILRYCPTRTVTFFSKNVNSIQGIWGSVGIFLKLNGANNLLQSFNIIQ